MAGVASRRGSAGPPTVRIRAYTPRDYAVVRRLWKRSGLEVGPSDTFRELERARRRDPELFLVAEARGRLIGTVLGRFDGRRGWLNHLAVLPQDRRRGVGTRLVRRLEERLRAKGCAKVNLHVLEENREVCAFYESLGYAAGRLIFMGKWLRGAGSRTRSTPVRRTGRAGKTAASVTRTSAGLRPR